MGSTECFLLLPPISDPGGPCYFLSRRLLTCYELLEHIQSHRQISGQNGVALLVNHGGDVCLKGALNIQLRLMIAVKKTTLNMWSFCSTKWREALSCRSFFYEVAAYVYN
jgi:hypothetical protein